MSSHPGKKGIGAKNGNETPPAPEKNRGEPAKTACKSGQEEDNHENGKNQFIYAMNIKSNGKSRINTVQQYLDFDRPIKAYVPQDIREAVAKARADLKGQTINETLLRLLRHAFDLAVEEKHIAENPVKRVSREKAAPIERKQFAWTDALRVLESVKDRTPESYLILRAMLLLGIGTAECKSLTGSSIDWNTRKVHFIRKKTGQPYHVPIFPWTEDFIRDLEPRFHSGKPIFDWRNPRKTLETACRACGFEPLELRSLRRTLIVHLLEQGVDPRLIASWQGHADSTLIYKVYGKHINASHEKAQLEKLHK